MNSLHKRLTALEQRFEQLSGAQQLELLYRWMSGDKAAGQAFEQLILAGKTSGRLDEVFYSIKHVVGLPLTEEAESEGI